MLPRSRVSTLGILVWLVAVPLAGCSVGSGDGEPPIPQSTLAGLVLLPEDLSDVFVRFDEGPLAIADAPVGERADSARFGRKGGWKARYRQQGTPATPGPLVVESRIDLFEDSEGAEREFDLHRAELEIQGRHPSGLELVEVTGLGEEAVALRPTAADIPESVVSFTLVWRDANVTASITANGFDEKLVLRHVLELGHAQQRRIFAAGGSRQG